MDNHSEEKDPLHNSIRFDDPQTIRDIMDVAGSGEAEAKEFWRKLLETAKKARKGK